MPVKRRKLQRRNQCKLVFVQQSVTRVVAQSMASDSIRGRYILCRSKIVIGSEKKLIFFTHFVTRRKRFSPCGSRVSFGGGFDFAVNEVAISFKTILALSRHVKIEEWHVFGSGWSMTHVIEWRRQQIINMSVKHPQPLPIR